MEEIASAYFNHTESRNKHLASIEESLFASNKELDSVRLKIEERIKLLAQKEKQLHTFHNKVMADFSLKQKELASVKEHLQQCMKDAELKERMFIHALHSPREVNHSDGNIRCIVEMDATCLLRYLSERLKDQDHDSISLEVKKILQLSPDPAKLVFDAMQWFYPNEGNMEIDSSVVRRSCILLLEQLIGLRPKVQSHVKEAMSNFACEWKAKMSHNSLEVLGFLHLLAAYGLGPVFAADEVSSLMEIVAHHKETPKLVKCLGFTHSAPDLIRKLIEKQQILQALRCVHAFGLEDSFPPAPLLNAHLAYAEALAEKLSDEGYNSNDISLNDIVGCIADQGLKLDCFPTKFNARFQELERDEKKRSHTSLDEAASHIDVTNPPKRSRSRKLPDPPDTAGVGTSDRSSGHEVVEDLRSSLKVLCPPASAECREYPDPEFNDFRKNRSENCFAAGQIWACYDSLECMPRDYALIKEVLSPSFKLKVTWLANPGNKGLSIACSIFSPEYSEEVSELSLFSHQVHWTKCGKRHYLIMPAPGETWALFKSRENHTNYKYQVVEVLPSPEDEDGVRVDYLKKVEGFVSLFQRTSQDGTGSFLITAVELIRFSHQIPSFRLTGKEKEGVPEGSFELDPASVPTDLDYSC